MFFELIFCFRKSIIFFQAKNWIRFLIFLWRMHTTEARNHFFFTFSSAYAKPRKPESIIFIQLKDKFNFLLFLGRKPEIIIFKLIFRLWGNSEKIVFAVGRVLFFSSSKIYSKARKNVFQTDFLLAENSEKGISLSEKYYFFQFEK